MRKAFTTLEMLAATALTALLMLAVMQVIGSIARTRAAMAGHQTAAANAAWKSDLLDSLRRDLANSTGAAPGPNALVLTGHAALDRTTLAPSHEPVTVTYGVTTIAGRGWLYRRQTPRDGFRGPAAWQELICPDVTRFTVRPAGPVVPLPAAPTDEKSDGAEAVPPAVIVQLDGPGGRVFEEMLVIR